MCSSETPLATTDRLSRPTPWRATAGLSRNYPPIFPRLRCYLAGSAQNRVPLGPYNPSTRKAPLPLFRNDRMAALSTRHVGCSRFPTPKREWLPAPQNRLRFSTVHTAFLAAKTEIGGTRDEIVSTCNYDAGVRSVAHHSRMHARDCASIRSVRPCETGWHRLHGRGACHMVRGTPRSWWWLSKIPLSILQGRTVGAGG